MSCPHCDAKRAATAAYLASIGAADWIEWARPRVDAQRALPTWIGDDGDPATMADCPCDCHSFARIVGRLPKLGPA